MPKTNDELRELWNKFVGESGGYPSVSEQIDFWLQHRTADIEWLRGKIKEIDENTPPSNYEEDNYDAGVHNTIHDILTLLTQLQGNNKQ